MADHSTQARKVCHCIQYFDCIKHASAKRAKLTHVELIYLHKIVSKYDQEIPQSQTADNPMAPRGKAAQPSRDIRNTN